MIYFNDKASHLVEAVYLGENVSDRAGDGCTRFVNPPNVKYIVGKTVIISSPNYPAEKINELLDNNCKVLERYCNVGQNLSRYILRICPELHWNGDELDGSSCVTEDDIETLLLDNYYASIKNKVHLYFPKIYGVHDELLRDSLGGLSWLGWALFQVGINTDPTSPIKDLDLLKTRKIHSIKSSQ